MSETSTYDGGSGTFFKNGQPSANSKSHFDLTTAEFIYSRAVKIIATKQEDMKMNVATKKQTNGGRDVSAMFSGNCIDVCSDALLAGGFDRVFSNRNLNRSDDGNKNGN